MLSGRWVAGAQISPGASPGSHHCFTPGMRKQRLPFCRRNRGEPRCGRPRTLSPRRLPALAMSVAARKLHEEARRVLLAHARALRDFDDAEKAFYQACERGAEKENHVYSDV